ncbi:hypothetical protein HMPREF1531_00804 [Propionibacterium sp. oral taxon 192 str. F0372]|nr:hypothetical protein HMPREF1531_00804 [Propionibacterium sp. oral taxon 192 str. F0372]
MPFAELNMEKYHVMGRSCESFFLLGGGGRRANVCLGTHEHGLTASNCGSSCGHSWCSERQDARDRCCELVVPLLRNALVCRGMKLDVQALADRCFVSVPHFRRLVAQVFGAGFTSIVWRYRVLSAYYSVLFEGCSLKYAASFYCFRGLRDLILRSQRWLGLPSSWLENPVSVSSLERLDHVSSRARENWQCLSYVGSINCLGEVARCVACSKCDGTVDDLICVVYGDPTQVDLFRFDVGLRLAESGPLDTCSSSVLVTPSELGISIPHWGPMDFIDMTCRELAIRGAYVGALPLGCSPIDRPVRIEFVDGLRSKPIVFMPVANVRR